MSEEAQEPVQENVDDNPPLDSVEQDAATEEPQPPAATEEKEPAEDGKEEVEERTVASKRQTPDGRFSLNDTVEIKGNRQGVIKFIGHVAIKNNSKRILVGLEVQGKTDGHDGSRGGIRYFHCAEGSGVMVPPGKLVRKIQNRSRPPKSPRGGANRVTSPRRQGRAGRGGRKEKDAPSASAPARGRGRGGNAKRDRNKGGRATETRSASRGNRRGASRRRVTDAPVEDQMREIFEGIKDSRQKWQQREDKLKGLAMLVDDPRMTPEHIAQCLQTYKKPFVQQVQDRYTTRAACAVLAKLCKGSPESFQPHVVFYLKKLMQQFKGNAKNAIEFVDKCCLDILQVIADDGVMLTELAKASQAKAALIRKHAFKYIGVLLDKHVPESNSDEKEPVIPEFVDVVDTALRTGLHDADAKVRDEAFHALYRLSLIDEIRAERLFQKMTKSSQKSYTRKFKNNARLLREESGRRMNRSPRGSPTRGSPRSPRSPRSPGRNRRRPKSPESDTNLLPPEPAPTPPPDDMKEVENQPLPVDFSDEAPSQSESESKTEDYQSESSSEIDLDPDEGNADEDIIVDPPKRNRRGRNTNSMMGDETFNLDIGPIPDDEDSDPEDVDGYQGLSPADKEMMREDIPADIDDVPPPRAVPDLADTEGGDGSDSTDEENLENESDAKELIESFLDLTDPQINWRMIEFLSKDDMTHLLMSYVSRLPAGMKVRNGMPPIDFEEVIPPMRPLESPDPEVIRATKMSWSLMRILSNENAAETVKSYLLRKCFELCHHALAVFHPISVGNVYHARIILETLLHHWPKSFLATLIERDDLRELVKNGLFRNLHQGNLNSFFLDLICYRPPAKSTSVGPLKTKLLQMFVEWEFIEYLIEVTTSPKHGDDISTKYGNFITDLLSRASSVQEAAQLLIPHSRLMVDKLMEAILDVDNTRTLWQRVQCGQLLLQILDLISREKMINPSVTSMADMLGVAPPDPGPNYVYPMFKPYMDALMDYVEQLAQVVISDIDLEPFALASGQIPHPFGQVRLNCLEILTLVLDVATFPQIKSALYGFSRIPQVTWGQLLDLSIRHHTNNLFLYHYRRLLQLATLYRRREIRYVLAECQLVEKFVKFYQTSQPRTTLHGYVLAILWDFYTHDSTFEAAQKAMEQESTGSNGSIVYHPGDDDNKDEDEDDLRANRSEEIEDAFDMVDFFESNEAWNAFYPVLKYQIDCQTQSSAVPDVEAGSQAHLETLITTLLSNSAPQHESDSDSDSDESEASTSSTTDVLI